ncbi:hypothetical protein HUN82_08630 [Prosthecochloris sp. DSM 1685]|nr:hypothetical protein [Prosthecochloris ethylica]
MRPLISAVIQSSNGLEPPIRLLEDMANNKPMAKRWRTQSLKRSLEGWTGEKNFKWQAILFALCLILFGEWFPDGLEGFFYYLQAVSMHRELVPWAINWKLVLSALFILLIWCIFKSLPRYTQIKVHAGQPKTYKVLAVFLSPFGVWNPNQTETYKTIDELRAVVDSDDCDREKMNDTKWAPSLSAIEYHRKTLREVVVFTSKETSTEFTVFRALVRRLYPSLKVREMSEGGMDFENIEAVFNGVNKLYTDAIGDGYREKDILVDVTGGNKPNSIAAAMATLAAGREFQYLNKSREVRSFDVDYDTDYDADS